MRINKKPRILSASAAIVVALSTFNFAQVANAVEIPNPAGVLNATTTLEFDGNSGEFVAPYSPAPALVTESGEIVTDVDIFPWGQPYEFATETVTGNRFWFMDNQWVPLESEEGDYFPGVYALRGNTDCEMAYGTHTFETITVSVSQDGEHTFRYVNSTTDALRDSYLAVYEGPFNPADLDEGIIVGCNDDRDGEGTSLSGQELTDVYPEFTATLETGKSYTLVLTTFNISNKEDFSDTVQGTFELWGPEDSLELPGFTVDAIISPAATGSVNRVNNDGVWTLTPTANAGNSFSSWTCVGSSIPDATANPLVFTPTADTTCTAVFVASEGAPVVQTPSLSQVNYFVTQGFAKGKSTLKNGMKAFINEQLDLTTGYKKFVCTGTVRGKKWTEKRTALANARAAVACDYIEDRFPRAVFELKKRLIKKQNQDAQTVRIRVFS